MTIQSVRAAASRLLRECGVKTIPVDVYAIAYRLGIPITEAKLGSVSALLVMPGGRAPRIVVNSSHPITRRRFSIAHEIGHAVLGHQFTPGEHIHVDHGTFVMQRGKAAATGLDPIEREANAFAAALLMPPELVRKELDKTDGSFVTEDDIERMANDFGVSVQALQFHMQNLKLIR